MCLYQHPQGYYLLLSLMFIFLDGCFPFSLNNRASNVLKYWQTIPEGFERPIGKDGKLLQNRPDKPKQLIVVDSVDELKRLFSLGYRVQDLDVRGDIASLLDDRSKIHPVVEALYKRKAESSEQGMRIDGYKIGLAIEGGGMRGCVGAGMIYALQYLGIMDSVDVVYGSSAGSLVGAYSIAGQMPYFGNEVYYDVLTTAGKDFIDVQSTLRSCGLGVLDLRFESIVKLFTDRMGRPVLNLNYLLDTIVQKIKPLDWDVFWEKQLTNKITLKVIASGLISKKAIVMSARDGNFQSLDELTECMKASMLIPGVAGDVVRLKGRQAESNNIQKTYWPEFDGRVRKGDLFLAGEPMTDALLYEPIPYRSALKENCTHVIALRTRGDDVNVIGKQGLMEKMIVRRFFSRKHGLPDMANWMTNQYHKLIYAEDVLILNEANRDYNPVRPGEPRLFGIAKPAGRPEIGRLETSREAIFNGMRDGFAAAYDSLVLDPALRGRGFAVAQEIWPDSLLTEVPKHLQSNSSTAPAYEVTAAPEIIVDSEVLPDIPSPPEAIEEALLNSEASKLPFSKRAALVSALKRFQRIALGGKS